VDGLTRGRWLCAIGKHVIRFQQDDRSTYVYATLRTSQEADLLMRLRRQGRISGDKVEAFARAKEVDRVMWLRGIAAYTGVDEATFAKLRVVSRVRPVARRARQRTG